MTFCLGWKSETAAFLIADSASDLIELQYKNGFIIFP